MPSQRTMAATGAVLYAALECRPYGPAPLAGVFLGLVQSLKITRPEFDAIIEVLSAEGLVLAGERFLWLTPSGVKCAEQVAMEMSPPGSVGRN